MPSGWRSSYVNTARIFSSQFKMRANRRLKTSIATMPFTCAPCSAKTWTRRSSISRSKSIAQDDPMRGYSIRAGAGRIAGAPPALSRSYASIARTSDRHRAQPTRLPHAVSALPTRRRLSAAKEISARAGRLTKFRRRRNPELTVTPHLTCGGHVTSYMRGGDFVSGWGKILRGKLPLLSIEITKRMPARVARVATRMATGIWAAA